jgi:hypothetical protein
MAAPLRGTNYCLMHDPDFANEVEEGRKLGRQRRKKEALLSGAYAMDGLRSDDDVFRLLEIATYDTLAQENSPARSRVLIGAAKLALELQQSAGIEVRLSELESAVRGRGFEAGRRR